MLSYGCAEWLTTSHLARRRHGRQGVDHHFWGERRLGDAGTEREQQVQQVRAQAGGRVSLLRYPEPGGAVQSASVAQQLRLAAARSPSVVD